jgi:translation elongation factor EF-Ts
VKTFPVRRVGVVTANDGVVGGYVHGNSRIAVLVELTGGDEELAKDVAMHVAACESSGGVTCRYARRSAAKRARNLYLRRQRTLESLQKSSRK